MRTPWLVALLALCGCDDDTTAQVRGDAKARVDAAPETDAAPAPEADAQTAPDAASEPDAAPPVDLEMAAADFDCMLGWTKVRNFYITNKLGRLEETLAVANNPEGGRYPAGTVVQLVPQEAMVKRAEGWNPATNDWEFFFLDIDGAGEVSIRTRGAEDTVNAFGGNCFGCHSKAAPRWDLVCEKDHGCDPLPISDDVIARFQQSDARCRD